MEGACVQLFDVRLKLLFCVLTSVLHCYCLQLSDMRFHSNMCCATFWTVYNSVVSCFGAENSVFSLSLSPFLKSRQHTIGARSSPVTSCAGMTPVPSTEGSKCSDWNRCLAHCRKMAIGLHSFPAALFAVYMSCCRADRSSRFEQNTRAWIEFGPTAPLGKL